MWYDLPLPGISRDPGCDPGSRTFYPRLPCHHEESISPLPSAASCRCWRSRWVWIAAVHRRPFRPRTGHRRACRPISGAVCDRSSRGTAQQAGRAKPPRNAGHALVAHVTSATAAWCPRPDRQRPATSPWTSVSTGTVAADDVKKSLAALGLTIIGEHEARHADKRDGMLSARLPLAQGGRCRGEAPRRPVLVPHGAPGTRQRGQHGGAPARVVGPSCNADSVQTRPSPG